MTRNTPAIACLIVLLVSSCGQPPQTSGKGSTPASAAVGAAPSVEELQAKVAELESRLATVESDVSEHDDKLRKVESDADELTVKVTNLDLKADDLDTTTASLKSDVEDIKLKLQIP